MKRIICILLVLVFAFSAVACGGSSEPEPSYEYTAENGVNCKVYSSCTISELTAVNKAIEAKVPDADVSSLSTSKCTIERFDDGLRRLIFSNLKVGDYEFGGECFFEFNDEDERSYSVHYLQVANQEYINDGIDLDAYYGAPEE